MLEALIITLREGIEAALVVGIIIAFLKKQSRDRYLPPVWWGIATSVAASFAGAYALYRVAVNEEAFEGILYLVSALVVSSLVLWMWRNAQNVAGELRGTLAKILERESSLAVSTGLFFFTFLMVFREGVETIFFLSALSLSTSGLLAALGTLIGLGAAITFGVLFVRGSLRIDLGRFFKITGITLLIFVLQLLINGYHELSEAGWVPANETTMGLVGPLVRNEIFFVAAVVLLPLLLLLIPGGSRRVEAEAEQGASARLERAAAQRQRRIRALAGTLGVSILVLLGFGFAHSQPPARSQPVTLVPDAGGEVRVSLAGLEKGGLKRYLVEVEEVPVRFIVVRLQDGRVLSAFDACELCGAKGYIEDGSSITCLHCHSAIYPPSIGSPGGCNPIPLETRREGEELVVAVSSLAQQITIFRSGGGSHQHS